MRSFYFPAIFAAYLFAACNSPIQEGSNTGFEWEYASPNSLKVTADSLAKIDVLLQGAVEKNWIAGAVAMVVKDGKIVFENTYGYRDKEENEPMEVPHLFRIASMTKPITSLAILQLHERGLLNVEDPVSKYISGFSNLQILEAINAEDSSWTARPANNTLKISDLLRHTSGISYGFMDTTMNKIYAKAGILDLTTTNPITIEENVNKLAALPLKFEPGEAYQYGLSIDVLGRIVEVASGEPLDVYFQKNIFQPLGMNRTGFYFDEAEAKNLTRMYSNSRDNGLIPFPGQGSLQDSWPLNGAKTYFSGGGGLISNAQDYARFALCVLNGGELGGVRIIKDETLKLMKTNQMPNGLRVGRDHFSFGFLVTAEDGDLRFGRKPGRLSWGGAFQTTFWIDPERNSIAIMLTQVYPTFYQRALYEGFESAVNSAIED
jgi:CubicO group peptidase (beta-lactamase class C family)